jgi:hypothetical protein
MTNIFGDPKIDKLPTLDDLIEIYLFYSLNVKKSEKNKKLYIEINTMMNTIIVHSKLPQNIFINHVINYVNKHNIKNEEDLKKVVNNKKI